MAEKLKARGADDAGALVSVRDRHPNFTNNTKYLYRSQFYQRYRVGPDLLAVPYSERKEVAHE